MLTRQQILDQAVRNMRRKFPVSFRFASIDAGAWWRDRAIASIRTVAFMHAVRDEFARIATHVANGDIRTLET